MGRDVQSSASNAWNSCAVHVSLHRHVSTPHHLLKLKFTSCCLAEIRAVLQASISTFARFPHLQWQTKKLPPRRRRAMLRNNRKLLSKPKRSAALKVTRSQIRVLRAWE